MKNGYQYLCTNSLCPDSNLLTLPAAGHMACISSFFDAAKAGADPAQTKICCTYVNLSSLAFDHHSSFITGYMSATWTTLPSSVGAAWIVQNIREVDAYLNMNSFTFPVDYRDRWFYVTVQPVAGGADHVIMAKYRFVYGSAPALQVYYDEALWDANYTAYGTAISDTNVVAASLTPASNLPNVFNDFGIYDGLTNAFWWGAHNDNMYELDSDFTVRGDPPYPGETFSPPFLRISFGTEVGEIAPENYLVSACLGRTYTSFCQILRQISPDDSGARNGPAMGKTRRTQQFAALLHGTQGTSFGTTETNVRPLNLKTPGGTAYTDLELFSGIYQGTIDGDYDYDSMICWKVTRPYPSTVVSLTGFLKTMDRN